MRLSVAILGRHVSGTWSGLDSQIMGRLCEVTPSTQFPVEKSKKRCSDTPINVSCRSCVLSKTEIRLLWWILLVARLRQLSYFLGDLRILAFLTNCLKASCKLRFVCDVFLVVKYAALFARIVANTCWMFCSVFGAAQCTNVAAKYLSYRPQDILQNIEIICT